MAQDFSKAADAYAKAADLGDANAQFSLGLMVAEGLGVKKDLRIAADLFEKAAQTGNPAAQYNLALIYLHGKGRPNDDAKAAEWMQKAAEAGQRASPIRSRRLLPVRPRRADRQGQGRGMDRARGRGRPGRRPGRVRRDAVQGPWRRRRRGPRRQAVPPRRRAGQPGRPEPAGPALRQWRGGEGRSGASRQMAFARARRRASATSRSISCCPSSPRKSGPKPRRRPRIGATSRLSE